MNQPANLNLFELLNWCVSHQPSALGIFVLNPRVKEIRMPRRPAPSGTCFHKPSGEQDLVGRVGGCECGEEHGRTEKCSACGEMISYHDFPGREPRIALVTLELPERLGKNLRGPEEDHAFLFAFSVDRAIYDRFVRQATSPIILPPGAQI